jgi:hypothetical protein
MVVLYRALLVWCCNLVQSVISIGVLSLLNLIEIDHLFDKYWRCLVPEYHESVRQDDYVIPTCLYTQDQTFDVCPLSRRHTSAELEVIVGRASQPPSRGRF